MAYCRAHSEQAAQVLIDIMLDSAEKGSTRVAAAKAIQDRAYGTPTQSLQISADPVKAIDLSSLSIDELRTYHELTSKIRPPDEVVDPDDMPEEKDLKNVTSLAIVPPQ